MNIANLPDINIANAPLPVAYENAVKALAACADIDECIDWANKMEALASYARQSEDETLNKLAARIRGRAVRRCGELLKQVDGRGGDRSKSDGADSSARPSISQRALAGQAGMSERQQVTAVRVANIPEDRFEEMIEADRPATITKLANEGKKTRAPVDHLQGRDDRQFAAATHTLGAMRRFAAKCSEHDAAYIAGGVLPQEIAEARRLVASIDAWLDGFIVNLKG